MGLRTMRGLLLPASVLLSAALISQAAAMPPKAPDWDAAAAARYLDGRLAWWRQWPKSQRDHGTVCVSCHTSLPHVLARPALRSQLGDSRRSAPELAMIDDVVKRVWLWNEVEPFYPDQTVGVPKSSESRGVESVLNALVLATRDRERGVLGPDTRQAFANMWALQMKSGDRKGGFNWLNFNLEPFESPSAPYWGATLAALAVARAPDGYGADPAVAPQIEALRGFLRTGAAGHSLYTRTLVLWADSELHGVLDEDQRQSIVRDLAAEPFRMAPRGQVRAAGRQRRLRHRGRRPGSAPGGGPVGRRVIEGGARLADRAPGQDERRSARQVDQQGPAGRQRSVSVHDGRGHGPGRPGSAARTLNAADRRAFAPRLIVPRLQLHAQQPSSPTRAFSAAPPKVWQLTNFRLAPKHSSTQMKK